jgi:HEAT repeat protein
MRRFLIICLAWGVVLGGRAGADIKTAQKVKELIKDLRSNRVKTRLFAAEELGHMADLRLKDAKPAIPALVKALKDPNPGVRKAVIEALAKTEPDPKEVVPRFMEIVEKDKTMPVRLAVVRALGQIGPPAKPAVKALTELQKTVKNQKPPKGKNKDMVMRANQMLLREIDRALRQIEGK